MMSNLQIVPLRSSTNEILTDPYQINNEFSLFYRNLYSSHLSFSKENCKEFLSNVSLPHLSEDDAADLGSQLTLDETENALKDMKKGKSPGLDGIPPEFYLTFWDTLGPYLFKNTNSAIISLLLKKGRDPLFVQLPSFIIGNI